MLASPDPHQEQSMDQAEPRIQLLLTGNEIMSGDTVDSNSSMIAQRLAPLSLSVYRKVTVGDDPQLLAVEMAQMAEDADILIVNGGLGPTIDDLTAEILAREAGITQLPLDLVGTARGVETGMVVHGVWVRSTPVPDSGSSKLQ